MYVKPRGLVLAAVLTVFAGSCSSEPLDSDLAAAEIVAKISPAVQIEERPRVEFGDDCVAEIVRDEYGFAIEVERCEPGTSGPVDDTVAPADAASWLGSGDALAVVTLVRELAITGDCASDGFGESLLSDLDSAVNLLKRSPDSELGVLGRRLGRLHTELDRLQSACELGRSAWLDVVDDVTVALGQVNLQLDAIRQDP